MERSHRVVVVAALALTPAMSIAGPVQALRWSLHPPHLDIVRSDALRSSAELLPVSAGDQAPEPTPARAAEATGVRLAPLLTNLLNSRRVTTLADVGVPGSGEGYQRGIPRTIGLAMRKAIF